MENRTRNYSIDQENQYIVDESPEINIGENPGWTDKIWKAFPALRHRNFQLYFAGQLVSLIGTWLQTVAQGWLIYTLTNSALWVGLITALNTIPVLLFSLHSGVIVDRYSRKKIIFFTQTAQMILAIVLGALTILKVVNIAEIAFLSFVLGVVTALDMPARQAFTVEMVGKEDLPSAIALNSGTFNAARVVGPAIAGALIAWIGTGGAFIVNGLTFLAVIIALFYIFPITTTPSIHPNPLKAIKEGLLYSFKHPIIMPLLVLAGMNGIFGWSYATIMPVIAKEFFNFDASGLGLLYAASGVGALVATFVISAYSHKFSPTLFIFGGNTLFCISLIFFAINRNIPISLLLLFLGGFGLIAHFSMMNTTLQYMVGDTMRGRVMSIYTLMFLGLSPLGSFEIGYLSEKFGSTAAILENVTVMLIFGTLLYVFNTSMKKIPRE